MSAEDKYYVEKGVQNLFEAHIQEYLARDLTPLGLGSLKQIGLEYTVDFPDTNKVGRIDILAQSEDEKTFYVIEIKRGIANRDAYDQIKRYMTRIKDLHLDKRVIGVLVASALDEETELLLKSNDIDFCEVSFSVHAKPVSGFIDHKSDASNFESPALAALRVRVASRDSVLNISREPRIQIRYRNGEKVVIKDSDRNVSFDSLKQQKTASIVPQSRKPKVEIRYVNDLKYVNGVLHSDAEPEELKSVLFNKFKPPIEPKPRIYAHPEGSKPFPLVTLAPQYSPLPNSETAWARYCWGCHHKTKKNLVNGRRWCVECRTVCDI